MEDSFIRIDPRSLQSRLTIPCIIFYALAALCGAVGIGLMFSGKYTQVLLQDMALSGITNPASQQTWMGVNRAVTLLSCLCPAIMATGLLLSRGNHPLRGMGLLSRAAQGMLWFVRISGGCACIVFVYRFFRYIAIYLSHPSGLMAIYSMVISEALMGAQAAFLFVMICRHLNVCIDSAASITYTLATSRLDSRSIPGFAATGFLILSIVGIALACNRMFTVTIVVNVVRSYYKLLVSSHPGLILESLCLVLGSAANFMMYRILKKYKQQTERKLFEARFGI